MLDELREGDWMSRSSRKSQKDIEHALHRLEQRLGRTPLESEIADELGMDLDDYQSLLGKVRGTQLVYLEDMSGGDEGEDFLERHVADSGADPFALLRDHRLRVALVEAIKALPEREQYIMGLYYEHSQAIARLRTKMRAH
jgi:RNA polymerase sigma factor for flagellar operon FliA